MVSLRSLVTGAVALMATTINAALTPQQIADSLGQITKLAADLQPVAGSITIVNAPLIVIGQGPVPQLIIGFQKISTTATVVSSQLTSTGPIQRRGGATITGVTKRGPDADLVYDAYHQLYIAFQRLLKILSDKAVVLENRVPFIGEPVAASLRQVEANIDAISNHLFNTLQVHAKELGEEASTLSTDFEQTIKKYDGLTA